MTTRRKNVEERGVGKTSSGQDTATHFSNAVKGTSDEHDKENRIKYQGVVDEWQKLLKAIPSTLKDTVEDKGAIECKFGELVEVHRRYKIFNNIFKEIIP